MADGGTGPGPASGGGWVPVPDPTLLTTEAVARTTETFRHEISALRELHDKDMEALRQLIDARNEIQNQDRIRLWEHADDIIKRFTDALADFRDEVARRDTANLRLIEQRLADLDKARSDGFGTLTNRAVSEREYILGQIANASAETRRVGDVSQEKFLAVDALFASNALALAAALAAQEKAVAAQNDSNTLAIAKSESSTKETISANAATAQTGLSSLANQVSDIKDRVVRIESTGVGTATARTEQRLSQSAIVSIVVALIIATGVIVSIIAAVNHK